MTVSVPGLAVMGRARTAVPFDSRPDTWHAPTQCVGQAAYDARLMMCVLGSGWTVPDDLVEEWLAGQRAGGR